MEYKKAALLNTNVEKAARKLAFSNNSKGCDPLPYAGMSQIRFQGSAYSYTSQSYTKTPPVVNFIQFSNSL